MTSGSEDMFLQLQRQFGQRGEALPRKMFERRFRKPLDSQRRSGLGYGRAYQDEAFAGSQAQPIQRHTLRLRKRLLQPLRHFLIRAEFPGHPDVVCHVDGRQPRHQGIERRVLRHDASNRERAEHAVIAAAEFAKEVMPAHLTTERAVLPDHTPLQERMPAAFHNRHAPETAQFRAAARRKA